MTGLILLLVLIPVVIFILLINILNKTSSQKELLESLNKKINELNNRLTELSKNLQGKTVPEKEIVKPVVERPQPVSEAPEPVKQIIPAPKIVVEEKPKPGFEVKSKTTYVEDRHPPTLTQPPEAKKGWWEKWIQNNPDIEKFIGENLANKIGIAILVLGISFFVKYAIDKEWINETGRVVIGLACGGLLTGIAHYFRNSYRAFSSVLAGGSIAVFYFTIAYASHQYQLISPQAAFIIMIVITAFAVTLSLLYNRLELAVIAVIGGFITPFLVNTGQDNYVALFTYLCILNTGLMVLATFKRWPVINSIALIFTVFIYGGWLTNRLLDEGKIFPYKIAMLFASLFYIQFMCMNIINNLRLKRSFSGFDFMIVLSTNFLYYAAGMIILHHWNNGSYQGLFTAFLGFINLGLAWMFYRNSKADKNFVFLLIGLTLTFISLAAPVQLKGNFITLFWSAEMLVLFWLYQQSRIRLIKIASALIAIMMVISLLMDWSQIYYSGKNIIPILANSGFITSLVSAISLFIYHRLMKKEADSYYLPGITNKSLRNLLLKLAIVVAYLSGALETWYQFQTRIPGIPLSAMYLQLYTFLFTLVLLLSFKRNASIPLLQLFLTIFCFVFYLWNLPSNYDVLQEMLASGKSRAGYIAHWISIVLLFRLLYDLVVSFRANNAGWKSYQPTFTWITTGGIILLLSIEVHHFMVWVNYSTSENLVYWQNLYERAGLSILWGVSSFVMMWLGMKYKFRTLRVISLTLFMITLIKLFGYDIRNITPGGKIAAFILLGVLLLTISFMYQRLKKIIVEDATEKK